ncbi:uncharacterized protein LOC124467716 isoform X2 [Hypomesus transpacificus]|uniref:uncharacterized protein LOC124467716 isoform X2 n=1 Tax=Hypomesus transpacificus TaxID=137520 RepID=UPI001F082DFB|nr:uncharacterized protein LOC124467716 isoform X2 [Hypomesus transpacificus]
MCSCLSGRHTGVPAWAPAMSQGPPSRLIQTLRKSPAVLRRKLRKGRIQDLSQGDPLFKVHYLGTAKIYSLDLDQAQGALSQLLLQAPEKLTKDHALVVRQRYVEVKEISTGRQLAKTQLRDIAYCAANRERPNVFVYICRQQTQQLQCRVFWCNKAERAKDITACLALSFQRALNDWQARETNHMQGEGSENGLSVVPDLQLNTSKPAADLNKGESVRTLHGGLVAGRRGT